MGLLNNIFRILLPSNKKQNEYLDPNSFFSDVYSNNYWKGEFSRSGPGSEGDFAKQKIELISELITTHKIQTILDIGCGDFYWMKKLTPLIEHYYGIDIVEDVVTSNTANYSSDNISFQCINLSDPSEQKELSIKKADLVICIDVFGHLLNEEVDSLLEFILNEFESKYLLLTNRRDGSSSNYLHKQKTRHEGIDLEKHPLFLKMKPELINRVPGLYPNDFFDFYRLSNDESHQP